MSWLTEHLDAVGESYLTHLTKASDFAVTMLVGGVACLIHAFLPFLFTRTASERIRYLHEAMLDNGRDATRRSCHQSADIGQGTDTGT